MTGRLRRARRRAVTAARKVGWPGKQPDIARLSLGVPAVSNQPRLAGAGDDAVALRRTGRDYLQMVAESCGEEYGAPWAYSSSGCGSRPRTRQPRSRKCSRSSGAALPTPPRPSRSCGRAGTTRNQPGTACTSWRLAGPAPAGDARDVGEPRDRPGGARRRGGGAAVRRGPAAELHREQQPSSGHRRCARPPSRGNCCPRS